MPFWSSNDQPAQAYDQYQNADTSDLQQQAGDGNQVSKVHELIGGAAAFEAAKAWEKHQAENGGPPPTHQLAKELLAGVAGAFVDREVESRGIPEAEKLSKEAANRHINQQLANNYAPGDDGAYTGGNNY